MKIHEYQAKELLATAGANVPRGLVASTAAEAQQAFDQIGGTVVLKAQVHAGGRGKGRFKTPPQSPPSQGGEQAQSPTSQGGGQAQSSLLKGGEQAQSPLLKGGDQGGVSGVKLVKSRDDVGRIAAVMLKYPLVTKQTGEAGQKVSKVLVQEASDIAREIYIGMVLDRAIGLPVLMACAEGGVEIEEVAARSPEKIRKIPVNPDIGLLPFQARRLAYELEFTGDQVPQAEKIMTALARVYLDKDCSLAEINPLIVTPRGEVQVLDAKMTFDDNAMFRHPEIEKLRDEGEENPFELRAARAGLTYISLTGNIGCLVNGAGLAMSTMDIIKYHGGEPANFLDVGGGANKDQVTEALRIILGDSRVQAVLINIFGGIMKCDTIAAAVIAAFKEVQPKVPFVVRLEGTNVALGKKMLEESGLNLATADGLTDAAKKVVVAAAR